MKDSLRKAVFAVPFAAAVAIATHAVRFGDDHDFGGSADEAIVTLAIGGSIAVAVLILHAFLTAGTTTPTGTIAAARGRDLIPGTAPLLMLAASIYYGIESLEGHGVELGLATVLLALFAAVVARALRGIVTLLAGFVGDLVRDWLARVGRQQPQRGRRSRSARPLHTQHLYAARRFGRAPPIGQHA